MEWWKREMLKPESNSRELEIPKDYASGSAVLDRNRNCKEMSIRQEWK